MRTMIFEFSWLRLLCIPLVILSGIVEKDFFRKIVMDAFDGWDYGLLVQILISAVIFAFAHIVWGFFMPVFISTSILGILLSLVFIVSGRIVLPAIIAHIVINLIIKPGLIYNVVLQSTRKES